MVCRLCCFVLVLGCVCMSRLFVGLCLVEIMLVVIIVLWMNLKFCRLVFFCWYWWILFVMIVLYSKVSSVVMSVKLRWVFCWIVSE